jgi:Tol biopolymer transport system component
VFIIKRLPFLFLFLVTCQFAICQTAQDLFGKNRIQYKSMEWSYLSTTSIDLYYYEGSEKLARTAIEIGETEFKRISELFGFTPYNKIKVFLYLSTNDRLMSNVGLGGNSASTGGKTNFTKSIAEVAYEGSLGQLKKQISAGIAQILIRDMLFGGSFKDAVQNSYLLNLPDWFIGGAIRYASEGAGPEMEDIVQDFNSQKRLRQPANFVGKESYLIGQSIWNYVAERYGRSSIGNILNLTRIIRNEENAIVGTLGMPFQTFLRDWKNYYQTRPNHNSLFLTSPSMSFKTSSNFLKKNYRQLQISPDGEYLVYSQDWKGKFQIVAYQIKNRKSHVIFRGGSKVIHQNSEGEFPVLSIAQDNRIWVAYPDKGKWKGMSMSMKGTKRSRFSFFENFHEVTSIQVSQDGKAMCVAGNRDNYSDVFIVNLSNFKIRQITQDWFDDMDPFFSQTGDSVIFSSNRLPTDTTNEEKVIPDSKRKLNLYKQSIDKATKRPELIIQSEGNLVKGRLLKDGTIVCMSDEPGTMNVGIFSTNRAKPEFLTTSKFHIKDFAYNEDFNVLTYAATIKMKPSLFLNSSFEQSLYSTEPKNETGSNLDTTSEKSENPTRIFENDSSRIDIRNYIFEDEKNPAASTPSLSLGNGRVKKERVKLKKEPKPINLDLKGPQLYSPIATANHLTTGLVVSPIPFWGLGALVDFSLHDIFENHHISGGMTYFFTDIEMRNNVSFLEYQYLKKRIDFKVRAERKSIQNPNTNLFIRQRDLLTSVSGTMSYPVSNGFRLDLSPYFQTTSRSVFDRNNAQLGGADLRTYYYGVSGEAVFDNTTQTGLNMISGTRFKIRSQYQIASQNSKKNFGELFLDFRTYQPIHKEITFAFRATFGSFFGSAPKKYSVGGMDNWLFRSYNVSKAKDDPLRGLSQNSLATSSDEAQSDWLFNRFSTNLRGFQYNAIYGSSFMLFNWELRIPIVQYLYKGPINSNFWRNLQVTGFADMGTAWTGVGPFNKNNSLNTKQINNGNFVIKVKTYENPFLTGFGAGARTLLLGYYTKFDVAWGRQNGFITTPQYYLTFGHDF